MLITPRRIRTQRGAMTMSSNPKRTTTSRRRDRSGPVPRPEDVAGLENFPLYSVWCEVIATDPQFTKCYAIMAKRRDVMFDVLAAAEIMLKHKRKLRGRPVPRRESVAGLEN